MIPGLPGSPFTMSIVDLGLSRQMPAGAPELDNVVALAGRDPGWSPG